MKDSSSPYGTGDNPPYSLYQAENGKWGLVNGNGKRLDAIFDRVDEHRFSSAPWEVVTFDPQEGMELLAWWDPCEAWFNFTWEDPAYPEEFAKLLWKTPKHDIGHYKDQLRELIPAKDHWLVEEILNVDNLDQLEDDEYDRHIDAMLTSKPKLQEPSVTNPLLDPVMRSEHIDSDFKIALWSTKVKLDAIIRDFKEEYPDGM